nr:hypothetical protein GZ27B6_30 [uncultured archaeon GZfos27B6]
MLLWRQPRGFATDQFFTLSAPVPWINDFIDDMVRKRNICHRSLLFGAFHGFAQWCTAFRAFIQCDGYRGRVWSWFFPCVAGVPPYQRSPF